jgi:hypothetical protein
MSQRFLSNTIYRNKPVFDIQTIDGYRVAFRRGTADERVIARGFSEDIFSMEFPNISPARIMSSLKSEPTSALFRSWPPIYAARGGYTPSKPPKAITTFCK